MLLKPRERLSTSGVPDVAPVGTMTHTETFPGPHQMFLLLLLLFNLFRTLPSVQAQVELRDR